MIKINTYSDSLVVVLSH